ncbi:MAG: energy transducer TonB [Planctomycetota bacterium]|nr:energy transducer TonB [Planctomycetota bacterium]
MYWTLEAAESFGALYAQRVARAQARSKPRARTRRHTPNALAISAMLHAAALAWIVALMPRPAVRIQIAEPSAPVAVVFYSPKPPASVPAAAVLWAPKEDDVVVESGEALPAKERQAEPPPQVEPPAEPEMPAATARACVRDASASPCVTAQRLSVTTARAPREAMAHEISGSENTGAARPPADRTHAGTGSEPVSPPVKAPPVFVPPASSRPAAAPARKGTSREVEAAAGNPTPDYPALARRKGLEGLVIVCVEVLESGRSGAVKLARSSGHAALDEAAVACAKRWRFRPALKDGEAVRCEVEVPFQFELVTARR